MMRGIFILIFVITGFHLHAQDALFSQMMNNRNLLNPSLMSHQNNPLDIGLNYREQGGGVSGGLPIRTFQAVANFSHKSFEVDRISYGISILGDQGGTGHIGSNMAHLHLAYLKKLTSNYSKIGEHFIGIGASYGIGQRRVDWDRFWFGNQFDRNFYFIDENIDPNEDDIINNNIGRSGLVTDLNAGVSWYADLNESLSMQAGFSIYHLDRANIALFVGGDERISRRYNFHFNLYKTVYDNLSLVPQVFYIRQGLSQQLVLGTGFELDNLDASEFVINFGILARIVNHETGTGMEAVILTLNTTYNGLRFGLGYDITVSSLARYNNARGAWELNLGYALKTQRDSGFSRKKRDFKF